MCGHVGIAGKLDYRDEPTMKRLLIYDYFRGPDSTGIAVINKEADDAKVVKIASHPLDLFDMTKFKSALSGHASSVFMGHNRAATRGAINTVGAHPFQFGHIVGCHNGTLTPASHKELEEALDEKFDVDSQAIFAAIEKFGIVKTVSMLQGAWALVWFDFKERTLNFLRNKERPFWYAYTASFDRILWASEWPMIDAAVNLASSHQNYELYTDSIHGYRFWQTPEDVHLKYDIDKLKAGGTEKPKPVAKELKGKAPAPVVTYGAAGNNPFPRGNSVSGNKSGQATTNSTTTSHGTTSHTSSEDNVVHLFGTIDQPFAGFITREKFNALAKYGCSWCGADVEFEDPGVVIFERTETIICPDCANGSAHSSRVYTTNLEEKRAL